jgi:hypothetical protein
VEAHSGTVAAAVLQLGVLVDALTLDATAPAYHVLPLADFRTAPAPGHGCRRQATGENMGFLLLFGVMLTRETQSTQNH